MCHFGDGVSFGMQYIGFSVVFVILTHILKSYGRTIVSVGDNHLVLDDECSHLAALAI